MPREAKPYQERGWYVSRPNGQYLRLCPVNDGMAEARRLLKLELGRLETEREETGGRVLGKLSVSELFALFLEDVETGNTEDTFLDYQRWCVEFAKQYGGRPLRSITKADANDFKVWLMKATYVRGKQPPKPYKPKTINHVIIALKKAFNWAIDTDRLPPGRNPFAKLQQLPTEGRKRIATEEEYQALLKHCSDDAFRDVLVVMRFTSARAQDVYNLEWPMVDWDGHAWVIHKHKNTRTARDPKPRIIGMNAEVERILRDRLKKHGPEGHVFVNSDGLPWNRNSLGLRMRRLRKRAGIGPDHDGEEFVLYTNRHTFITAGADDTSVSRFVLQEVGGHTDPRTTARYIHLAQRSVADAGRRIADRLVTSSHLVQGT